MTDIRIVGIMMAKDESDVISDVFASLVPALSHLYMCAQDEPTRAAALAAAPPGWLTFVAPAAAHCDGHRGALLDHARRGADGDPRPMWVMVVQGDEIYGDDLLPSIHRAHEEQATALNVYVPTFVLHESQRNGWDWMQPIDKRLTHCVWGGGEHGGFLDAPPIHYRHDEHMRAFPHGIIAGRVASVMPVRRHYPMRTPEQARARIADRVASGWQPNYVNYLPGGDVFAGDAAYGLPVRRYDPADASGSFAHISYGIDD